MIPEEAHKILRKANEPWKLRDKDGNIEREWAPSDYTRAKSVTAAQTLDAIETIADMHYEYAVQARHPNGQWHQVTEWNPDPNPYKPGHAPRNNERLVRRLVSEPEVMK